MLVVIKNAEFSEDGITKSVVSHTRWYIVGKVSDSANATPLTFVITALSTFPNS